MRRLLRIVIEILILAVIVFTPMCLGGTPRWTWVVFELMVATAVLLWLLRMAFEKELAYVKTPLNLLLLLLLVYIFFQCVPLPAGMMLSMQPNTLKTYAVAPPPFAPADVSLTGRATVPVTLNRQRTRDMLLLYMGYVGLFMVIINNVTTRQQVGRLVGTVLAIGVLLSLAGLATFKQDQRLLYRLIHAGGEGEMPWFLNPYANPEDSAGYGFVFHVKEGDVVPERTTAELAAYNVLGAGELNEATKEDKKAIADAERREKYGPDWYVAKAHAGDVFGSFQSSNSAATVLGMSVMVGLGVFFAYLSTRRAEWGRSGGFIYTREGNVTLLVLIVLALTLLALTLTRSRAAIALLPVFLLGAIVVNAFGRSLLAGAITTAVIVILVLLPFVIWGWQDVKTWVDAEAAWHLNPWEDLRLLARQSSWKIIHDFPLFGTGLGTYGNIYPSYKIMGPMMYFAHCDPLQWMAETGLVGTVLGGLIVLTGVLTVIWGWLKLKDRFMKRLLMGCALGCLFFLAHGWVDFPLSVPGVVVVFVAVASVAFILSRDQTLRLEQGDFTF